ncbi:unnamed protein product [Mytilus coruscus]|uniref:Uncharacterized protein n=1 Tax=Mytilus coruscus TaxID=42192 RepID=A0A6J8E5K7_MYTCO|nr:unnamed protein product [Mytilus coruscus]
MSIFLFFETLCLLEITSEHREETSTVSQQQTSLIITRTGGNIVQCSYFEQHCNIPNLGYAHSDNTKTCVEYDSCSMACFYVGKKYQNNQNLEINQIVDINNRGAELDSDTQRSPDISTGRGSGNGYAEIDEFELSEFILTPPEHLHLVHDDSSSESSDRNRPPNNDYLNSYQSSLPSLQQPGSDQDDSDESS